MRKNSTGIRVLGQVFLWVATIVVALSLTACEIRKVSTEEEETGKQQEQSKETPTEQTDAEEDDSATGQENSDDSSQSSLDSAMWQEDLEQLKNDITWYNTSPFQRYGEEAFYSLYQEIYNEIPNLNDEQREYRFRELIYSIGDGHIDMWTEHESDLGLPIMIDELKDGFYIVNAIKQYKHLIGERVETINGMPIDELVAKLEKISNSENQYWQRNQAIEKLHYAYFYKLLGIQNSDESVLTVNDKKIAFFDMIVGYFVMEWELPLKVGAIPNGIIKDATIFERPYHHEFLEDGRVLVITFSSCYYELEDYPLTQFGEDVLAEALEKKPEVLLIDLRDNGGGRASQLYAAFSERFFTETGFLNNPNFFVATDSGTFSAGVLTAHVLRGKFGATLIGTPTGGSPYTTGVTDTANKVLKNTGISFRVSAEKIGKKMIQHPSELPDYVIEKSSSDLQAGLDPVIEFVKAASNR